MRKIHSKHFHAIMRHIFIMLSALLLTFPGTAAYAQKKGQADDYNLRKAYEVLKEDGDEAKALDLVNQQLQATPDNVEAIIVRARLLRHKREYGDALADLNYALKVNKPKKSDVPNSFIHWWKGYMYQDMGDYAKAKDSFRTAYEMAAKDDKDNLNAIAFDYAQRLYSDKDLDAAEAVYRRILSDDESYVGAMVGLARNMIDRGQYREAVELLEKCRKYDPEYHEPYRFKMYAFDRMGETTKAIDAGLDWFDKSDNAQTDSIFAVMAKRPVYAEASVKDRKIKSDEPVVWLGFLGSFYEHIHKYAEAVACYNEIEASYGFIEGIVYSRSQCYSELGLYDKAIADASRLIEKEPDLYSLCARGDYYRLSGNLDSAIKDFTAAIGEAPKECFPYYRRGWCKEMKGDRKGALEDYDIGIELNEDYPYLHLMRGELLLLEGRKDEAVRDFEVVVRNDTIVRDGSCRQYALHFLGRGKEAEEWMDKIIAAEPDDAGHYYDRACLYARMGRLEESVAALKVSLEKGYRSFAHIRQDDDMDPVRDLPEFKALINEYEAVHEKYLKESGLAEIKEKPEERPGESGVTEIAIKRNPGGTFEIPCDINGLALRMIFDTGASDVTISSVEANFMFKNGYLSDKDIKGKRYYQIADGQISEGTVITLREVKIGEAVLRNVDASVVKSQKAPLLLGQSVMERFGTITIDNQNNKLIIKH